MIRTESHTEAFYDSHDRVYRSFWDPQGSLHWGLYDDDPQPDGSDYLEACLRTNEALAAALAPIGPEAHVLDLGCGNGNSALWLAQRTGARVTGIDLSGVRIAQARDLAAQRGAGRVAFHKASATELPFEDGTFTHVWSQATLYHVHRRARALSEVARVLRDNGTFVFDDLVQPRAKVSCLAKQYVYDRLLFGPTYSHDAYRTALSEAGLMVLGHADWTAHLRRSYRALGARAVDHADLVHAYARMVEAIDLGDLGWSFFRAVRVADPLAWVYREDAALEVASKYDAWAPTYEATVGRDYHALVDSAAARFAEACPLTTTPVLDIGCGTGLVGEALARRGASRLVGIDPSREMLSQCHRKGLYTSLHEVRVDGLARLGALPFPAAIAVGVFTKGHAPLSDLRHVAPLLGRDGVLAVCLRRDVATQEAIALATACLEATYAGATVVGQYDGTELALHLWRRAA